MPTSTNTPTTISNLVFSIFDTSPSSPSGRSRQRQSPTDGNKFKNLWISGPLEFSGRGHQQNLAIPKHRHPIGNAEDLWNLMADHDCGKTEPPLHGDSQIVDRLRQ